MPLHRDIASATEIHEEKHAFGAEAGSVLQFDGANAGASRRAFIGFGTHAMASASDTLVASEYTKAFLRITGVLTVNSVVIVPLDWGPVVVENATTGAYTLTVKTSGGTGVTITATKRKLIASDGVNVVNCGSEV